MKGHALFRSTRSLLSSSTHQSRRCFSSRFASVLNNSNETHTSSSSFSSSLYTSICTPVMNNSTQRRHMSVFSSVTDWGKKKVAERAEEGQGQQFKELMEQLVSVDKYTLETFYAVTKDMAARGGVTGWKSKLPGMSARPQTAEMKKMLLTLAHFTPSERQNPSAINQTAKERVARDAGVAMKDVEAVMNQYTNMRGIHIFLKEHKARGKEVPETQDELMSEYRKNPPKDAIKEQRRRYSKLVGRPKRR